jgi:hypothetical protein
MPDTAAFNVLIADTGNYNAFVHTTTASNKIDNKTILDHPDLNGNPDAVIITTYNWNPGGRVLGIDNPHITGVQYLQAIDQWAIFNEDMTEMPDSASFNVIFEKQPEPDPEPLNIESNPLTKDDISLNVYTSAINSDIRLDFSLNHEGSALIQMYSTQGQLIETLTDELLQAGPHSLTFDGSALHSGYYLITLKTKYGVVTQGFSIVK